MLESEPILVKNVKIERNMQDKIEEIASLGMLLAYFDFFFIYLFICGL